VSWFERLFGQRPILNPAIASRIVDLVAGIIATSKDRDEIRQRIAAAAHAGDLDFLIEGLESDKKKAQSFIDNG
jgi:hypothetical protein